MSNCSVNPKSGLCIKNDNIQRLIYINQRIYIYIYKWKLKGEIKIVLYLENPPSYMTDVNWSVVLRKRGWVTYTNIIGKCDNNLRSSRSNWVNKHPRHTTQLTIKFKHLSKYTYQKTLKDISVIGDNFTKTSVYSMILHAVYRLHSLHEVQINWCTSKRAKN